MTLMPVTRMAGADRAAFVDRLADDVHDAAERLRADRDRDLRAGVDDFLAADETFGRVHRDGTHGVFTEVLRDFEDQRVGAVLRFERGQDGGQFTFELHVDDSADDLADGAVGRLVEYGCGGHDLCPDLGFNAP